jgi:hypothetical protein
MTMVKAPPEPGVTCAEVHAVCIGDDIVVLDLRTNTYLCLPGASAPRRADSAAQPDEGRLAEILLQAGLVLDAQRTPRALPVRARADLEDAVPGPLRWRDLIEAARASLDVLLAYRGRTLAQLLALAVAEAPAGRTGANDERALELARAFRRWSVLCPVPGKCLVRSFMLLRYLQRHGASADWVFGVRTWPFRAHCWLQVGAVAIDDAHERLVAYSPILAVAG